MLSLFSFYIFIRFNLMNSEWICLITSPLASIGIKSPPGDYSIPGTSTSKIFTTIGASANLVFAYNTGMLPEIQVSYKLIFICFSSFMWIHNSQVFHFFMCSWNWVLFMVVILTGDNQAASSQEHDESPVFSVYCWSSAIISGNLCRILGLWIFNSNLFDEWCEWSSLG